MDDQPKEQGESSPPGPQVEAKRMSLGTTLAICSGGWLIPGLAHILIGRWVRGLIFAACVLLMFAFGLGMQGKLYGLEFDEPLHLFAFIANVGAGIPYWVAGRLDLGLGTMTWPSYDYGTTYLWVCGLLNYLIVLDAFDIAQGRKP
jgi:hypothetical protein